MRTTLLSLGLAAIALHASAADFTRAASFDSVAVFVATAKTFQPATAKSDLAALFTVRDDDDTAKPVTAPTIQSSTALWSNDALALVFVIATPPTNGTRSSVGVLFLLARERRSWRVSDVVRFTATGKYAGVSAELTAGTGIGYHLGSDSMWPVITIKESHGGRGYAYQSSASYTLEASKLKRLELE